MSNHSTDIRPAIKPGCRIGRLTVTEKTDGRKGGYYIWRCHCDCGGEILLDTRCLQRGKVTSCGCASQVKPGMIDLTDMRFGRLVCIRPTEERDSNGSIHWLCRCDCGNICSISAHQLRSGNNKSCGCLGHPPLKDYIGKRFGKLTVIEYAGKEKGKHRWRCRCECGNVIIAGQPRLQSGQTKSCGCHLRVYHGPKAANSRGLVKGTCVARLRERLEKPPIASNTSGHNGVYKNTSGSWTAQITFQGKTRYLGSYTNLEDAVEARKNANQLFEDFILWYQKQQEKEQATQLCPREI